MKKRWRKTAQVYSIDSNEDFTTSGFNVYFHSFRERPRPNRRRFYIEWATTNYTKDNDILPQVRGTLIKNKRREYES